MKKHLLKLFVFLFLSIGMLQISQFSTMAATIGTSLTNPEDGWKRYDSEDPLITLKGNWRSDGRLSSSRWNGSAAIAYSDGDTLSFKFYGTKLRVLCENYRSNSSFNISIDGGEPEYINLTSSGSGIVQCLSYEKLNLNLGVHTVVLTAVESRDGAVCDAFDIDENGYLISDNQSASVLKIIMEQNEQMQLSIEQDLSENLGATWTSSDSTIASVDANGIVSALTIGNAIITVTYSDGTEEYVRVLVVERAKDYRLAVDLKIGQSCRLTIDDNTSTTPVTWTVMDNAVASVSDTGKVTAVGSGLTIVTATNEQGEIIDQIYIRVRA